MNKGKNILYVGPDISVKGGVSAVIKGYLGTDLSRRHKIFLVSSHVDGTRLRKLLQAVLGIIKALYHLVFNRIDIVHVHEGNITSFKRKFYFVRLASVFKCRIIFHHHGGSLLDQYTSYGEKWKKRIKQTFEQADVVISLTEGWRDAILSCAPAANVEVIPNAVKLPDDLAIGNRDRNRLILTFLGHINNNKGIFDLLKVVKRLIDAGINVSLKVGGIGDIARLKKMISDLDIEGSVEYLGWISEAERDSLLRDTDIFVLPSHSECLPMSILEAASYAIPVVATNVGGIPEIVHDTENGFLVQPGNLDALYERLKFLIQHKDLRIKLGETGRQLVKDKYNLDTVVRQMDAIYSRL